ncbi:hypothetical protein ACQJBY_022648 [Aegilops geniculata]
MAMAMASLQDVQQQIFEYNGYTPYSRWSGMSAAPVQVSCANQSPPQVLDGTPGTSSACSPTRGEEGGHARPSHHLAVL